MAELRQVLSNETINDYDMVVLSDGIDWSRYEKNPVLLENHDWDSQPIGNVVNIHREGNDWIGTLKFAEGTERGKTAKYLYENGVGAEQWLDVLSDNGQQFVKLPTLKTTQTAQIAEPGRRFVAFV